MIMVCYQLQEPTLSADILYLARLKQVRLACNITNEQLGRIAKVPHQRVIALETRDRHRREEPWLDEARDLCRATSSTLLDVLEQGYTSWREIDVGYDAVPALDVWACGVRLPLRYGLRLAKAFDLADPFELLDDHPMLDLIWTTLASGGRGGATRTCPMCDAGIVGEAGHFPSCTLANLMLPRDAHISLIGAAPRPFKAHKRRGGSRAAPGLKYLRAKLGYTQQEMADLLGIQKSSYYRLEAMKDNLTPERADAIAITFKVPVVELYTLPGPGSELSGNLT